MRPCRHCGQPAVTDFCCSGCEAVYGVLHSQGWDEFYRHREPGVGRPPVASSEDFSAYDQVDRFEPLEGGGRRLRLSVEGLHCSACLWLIERAMKQMSGVRRARVNLSREQLTLELDDELSLPAILRRLAEIGYRGYPLGERDAGGDVSGLLRLAVAGFGAGNIMLMAVANYLGQFQGMEAGFARFFDLLCFVLATPVVFYSARPFFTSALSALKMRGLTMDVPIAIGLSATYATSVINYLRGEGPVYFDTAAVFCFVLLVARALESGGRRRLGDTLERLLALRPRQARLENGQMVPVGKLRPEMRVRVFVEERIPVDGAVLEGSLAVDESVLTGESLPAQRTAGHQVMAGTRVVEGEALLKVLAVERESVLSQIAALVEQAQARQWEPTLWDRASGWFVGVTLLTSLLTFFFWLGSGLESALSVAVSVLIITCPCALGLAAPLALWRATRDGFERGIVFRSASRLHAAAGISHVLLDKTGTLTDGKFTLAEVFTAADWSSEQVLAVAAGAEREEQHPLARAILERCPEPVAVEISERRPGCGVIGSWQGQQVLVGNRALLAEHRVMVPAWASQKGLEATEVWLAYQGQAVGLMTFEDALRPEAESCVKALLKRGLKVSLVSGDRESVVRRVGQQLQIDFQPRLSAGQARKSAGLAKPGSQGGYGGRRG